LGVVKEEEEEEVRDDREGGKQMSLVFFLSSFQCYRLLCTGRWVYFLSSVVCLDLKRRRRHFLVVCFCFVISNNVKKKEKTKTEELFGIGMTSDR
jgi:hypothetical protein